ncbi:RHS repeat-associated core domain-containing protein [Chryseobacterium sp.]|uniref:RHS repeat domain-containing protein n=1 Tax=Chryseobacterium sp. TaxID=1871047 RepID=UPI002357F1D9|nr:RHS repeat-associated core domain-containing protein [Chryseobacterium sp.]
MTDANGYYPFGMNHLKTGNAFYGQGSYKNYKFLGKELQEISFYDLEARFYMPDLGIFGQHDPLSAATLDPYGYAYNNPMFFSDPTGLYGAQVNKKGELPATSPGGADNPLDVGEVVLNAPIRAMASNPGSVLPSNCILCYSGRGAFIPGLQNMPPPRITPQRQNESWYGISGKSNWYLGNIAIATSFKGLVNSQIMYSKGVRRGIAGNYRLTGRNLSLFGKAAMNDVTKPISQVGRIGKGLGTGSFYLGIAFDVIGAVNGEVSTGKVVLNSMFGAAGNWGGPIGASIGTIYFGVDNFYDGPQGQGWPGFFNGANDFQSGLDQSFNNAGPYRMNIMGAHEPK